MKIDMDRALEIIDKFSKASILVVGDLMLDHYIYGTTSRVSPEAPVPIVDVSEEVNFLGGSGNVINNIYEAGGKVFVTGVIGDDEIAKRILLEFYVKKIETDGIFSELDRKTTLKTRIISHDQQVARYDIETKKDSSFRATNKMLDYIKSKKDEIDVIVISDYNKGTITKNLINGILNIVYWTNIKVCVDPKKYDLSFYNGVDVVTPNYSEAIKSLTLYNNMDIETIGKSLLSKMNFESILITRSEKGMSLFEKQGNKIIHTHFSSRVVNISDVSGAGDTVIAIFSLCVASGATFLEATEISNIAAGIVVSKLGTATVTVNELKNRIRMLNRGE